MTEYLSIDLIDPTKVVVYEKWVESNEMIEDVEDSEVRLYRRIGLLSTENDTYHKYCGYNQFTVETYPLPLETDGWKGRSENIINKVDADEDNDYSNHYSIRWITKYVCDPTAKIFTPKDPSPLNEHQNGIMYKTLDNYDIGFVVIIEGNKAYIYGRTHDVIISEDYDELITFENLIKEYEFLEIFIGSSPLNEMTKFSGGHGAKWDGNSILLRIGPDDEFKYVHIGMDVYEFTTDEKIIKYVSSVGNNCVPYPYAESENWCYDMSNASKIHISGCENREVEGNVFNCYSKKGGPLNKTLVNKRETHDIKHPISSAEKTNWVKFKKPKTFTLINNSCTDETLPAVQQVNAILN